MFQGPISRTISRASQTVPVDPQHGLTSTLLFARAILERGNALTWFPEGERTPDGSVQRFLPGAGLLIQKTKVPAVPVLITGAYEAWPISRSLPRPHPIRLRFGAPLMLADSEPEDAPDSAQRIAERLRDAVLALADGAAKEPGAVKSVPAEADATPPSR
jgi:long-chain acyl-CoA synthetase